MCLSMLVISRELKTQNLRHIQLCKSIAFQQYINKLDHTRRESSAILATTLAPLPIELSPTSRRMVRMHKLMSGWQLQLTVQYNVMNRWDRSWPSSHY